MAKKTTKGNRRSTQQARDGFFGDLPNEVQKKVMIIHKFMVSTLNEAIKNEAYDEIRNTDWAKAAIAEFCTMPMDKKETGSVRVYKKGKRFSCMIQLSGHFINQRNDLDHEVLHELIRDVHQRMRPSVRKKYDVTLTCESEHGERFEGIDVWTSAKTAKEIWELFEGKVTKNINENSMVEDAAVTAAEMKAGSHSHQVTIGKMEDLPRGLQKTIYETAKRIFQCMNTGALEEDALFDYMNGTVQNINEYGFTEIIEDANSMSGIITLIAPMDESTSSIEPMMEKALKTVKKYLENTDSTKELVINGIPGSKCFEMVLTEEYTECLMNHLVNTETVGRYIFDESDEYDEDDVEEIEERGKSKTDLKYSFRMGINVENGHLVKIVFDLNKDNVKFVGSHDDTNPVSAENQKKIIDNITKTGYTDFVSREKVIGIVDMDTKERLQTVVATGVMSGLQAFASKPLKEREELARGEFTKLHGGHRYTVGEVEGPSSGKKSKWDDFTYSTYKSTRPAKQLSDLSKFQKEPLKYGRGFVKESADDDIEEILERVANYSKEFRFVLGADDGHLYKIVYEMNPDNVLSNKDNQWSRNTEEEVKDLKKDLRHSVHNNYMTKGNKVVAIVDECTGKRVNELDGIPPIAAGMGTSAMGIKSYMSIMKRFIHDKSGLENLEKELREKYKKGVVPADDESIKEELAKDPSKKKYIVHYKVGQIDNSESFKTNRPKDVKRNFLRISEAADTKDSDDVVMNTDMTEAEAKRTIGTLSSQIIAEMSKNSKYKISQYTANIYANIITRNLLAHWAPGFRKLTITLDDYQSFNTFEFKIPNLTQDFVFRYVNGRETLDGLLHRNPEIRIKMSPKLFHQMKERDDAYNFFKAAIKYYSSGINKYAKKLMASTLKMNHEMKHLISTTKLSGLVTTPMKLLFVFDDVNITNKDTFKIPASDIEAVNNFMKSIYTKYAAPEKEKKQIVEDLQGLVKSLHESCDMDDMMNQIVNLPEAVTEFYDGKYDSIIKEHNDAWVNNLVDITETYHHPNAQVRYYTEFFGVKKLKKIPSDLVAYITIETESIKDANDKMMIASYCLSKIEIVEWYIELLDTQNRKYVVPHTKPQLERIRTQLLQCYKNIMAVKIIRPNERPIIDIRYPSGYEG